MTWLMVSRSERISARFLVPSTFRRVVAASSRVEWLFGEVYQNMTVKCRTNAIQIVSKPVVLNIVCGHRGIRDPVVNDGVHAHRHRVPRENLEGRVFMSIG